MAARKGARKGHRKQLEWRRDAEILARLDRVEPLHAAGWPSARIAEQLGVSPRTIRQDVDRLATLWIERVGATQDEHRGRLVAQLDETVRRSFAAAELDDACTRAVLFGEPVVIDGKEVEVVRDRNGVARFSSQRVAALNAAREAIVSEAKLLGLIVDKVAPTDASGETLDLASLAAAARVARAERLADVDVRQLAEIASRVPE